MSNRITVWSLVWALVALGACSSSSESDSSLPQEQTNPQALQLQCPEGVATCGFPTITSYDFSHSLRWRTWPGRIEKIGRRLGSSLESITSSEMGWVKEITCPLMLTSEGATTRCWNILCWRALGEGNTCDAASAAQHLMNVVGNLTKPDELRLLDLTKPIEGGYFGYEQALLVSFHYRR